MVPINSCTFSVILMDDAGIDFAFELAKNIAVLSLGL